MELILTRTYYSNGTNGVLRRKGSKTIICYTIELPWKNNKRSVSCIPEGTYPLKLRFSNTFSIHFILPRVKDRSLILVHPANDAMKELKGCIAPVTTITGEGTGIESMKALARLKGVVMSGLLKGPVFITIKSDDHDD